MAHFGKVILDDFVPTSLGEPSNFALASCAHLEVLAHQWREYYDVPDPFPHGGPTPTDPTEYPNQQPLLRACWGRSAFRHSQGNPALSLSTPSHHSAPYLPATSASTISTLPMTTGSTPRRQWLAQSPIPPSTPLSSPSPTNV